MPGSVTVACKIPSGIVIHVDEFFDFDEPVMGGGIKTVKRGRQKGETVKLNGYVAPYGMSPKNEVVGGFGLTHGVDADFWDAWQAQNKDSDYVKNGLVFAHSKPEYVAKKADERSAVRNGLEPIDPNKLPPGIKTADEQPKMSAA